MCELSGDFGKPGTSTLTHPVLGEAVRFLALLPLVVAMLTGCLPRQAVGGSDDDVSEAASDAPAALEEPFYEQISRAVIRLEDRRTGKLGTGFFVADGKRRRFALVTARHVAEAGVPLRARVPSQRRDTGETEVVELRVPPEAWVFHPESGRTTTRAEKREPLQDVDIAVAWIRSIKDRRFRTVGYCPEDCGEWAEQQFFGKPIEPPARVLVFGFPLDLGFGLEEQRPLGRVGIVSLIAKEPFLRTRETPKAKLSLLRDEHVFLIDAPLFGGNSGSPVFRHPTFGGIALIGLVSASNEKLSYAIVEPVSRIAEAIEAAAASEPAAFGSWYLLE